MGSILHLERALRTGAVDRRINRHLPRPNVAWHASSVGGAGYFDHGSRIFRPWTQAAAFSLLHTPAGAGVHIDVGGAISPGLDNYPDPDDTRSVYTWTLWLTSLGSASSDAGYVLRPIQGSTATSSAFFAISNAGFRADFGGAATATIVAAADVRYGVNTLVAAVSDGAVEWWLNGKLVATQTSSQAWAAASDATGCFRAFRTDVSGVEATAPIIQGAAWVGPYNQFAERLSQGPHALWEPARIWVPVSAGGTAATVDQAATYAVRSAATADQAASYSVRQAGSADQAASYAVRAAAASDQGAGYSVRSAATADQAASYSVGAATTADQTAAYAVRVAAQADQACAYSVRGTSMSDQAADYTVAGGNIADQVATYAVRQSSAADQAAGYAVRLAATGDYTAGYAVFAAALSDQASSYAVRGGVVVDQLATYVVQAASGPATWPVVVARDSPIVARITLYSPIEIEGPA